MNKKYLKSIVYYLIFTFFFFYVYQCTIQIFFSMYYSFKNLDHIDIYIDYIGNAKTPLKGALVVLISTILYVLLVVKPKDKQIRGDKSKGL